MLVKTLKVSAELEVIGLQGPSTSSTDICGGGGGGEEFFKSLAELGEISENPLDFESDICSLFCNELTGVTIAEGSSFVVAGSSAVSLFNFKRRGRVFELRCMRTGSSAFRSPPPLSRVIQFNERRRCRNLRFDSRFVVSRCLNEIPWGISLAFCSRDLSLSSLLCFMAKFDFLHHNVLTRLPIIINEFYILNVTIVVIFSQLGGAGVKFGKKF